MTDSQVKGQELDRILTDSGNKHAEKEYDDLILKFDHLDDNPATWSESNHKKFNAAAEKILKKYKLS